MTRRTLGALLVLLTVAACSSEPSSVSTVSTASSGATSSAVATTTSTSTAPSERRVLLVGDSLAVEATRYLDSLLDVSVTLDSIVIGGTAPCDFVDAELPLEGTDLVVLSFNGNALTDCTHDEGLVEQYRTDLRRLIERARAAGAGVVLVDQPIRRDDGARNTATNVVIAAIDSMIVEFAAEFDDVTVSPAGAAVEADDGSFALRLPCRAGEPSCGPDGTNVVRNDDGVHFCPGGAQWNGACDVYSSGAYRFASVIAASVLERLGTV